MLSERRKYLHYQGIYANTYFWRTMQQQEIDYLEEIDGKFSAFEIKWNSQKKPRFTKTFIENYPVEECQVINPDTFSEWLR